jgi:hypothetical protein
MIRKIAERLAKTKYVREVLKDPTVTSLKDIKIQFSFRIIAGLILIGFSYIIGWPAVAAFGFLAVYFEEPLIVVIGGPTIYGISHVVFLVGAWLAGARHARLLMRHATKSIFRKILPNSREKSAISDVHPTGNNHS